MVYYILFSIYRVGIIFFQGFIEVLLALLNHFPLFSILLRLKDSYRVSSGIGFEIYDPDVDYFGFNIFHQLYKSYKYDLVYQEGKRRTSRSPRRKTLEQEDLVFKEIKLESAYLIMKVSYNITKYEQSIPISLPSIFYQYNYLANE
jgi:hypothetical protein